MSQWAGGVLTAAGRALQAKVEAGTTPLVLTKIKLGDGTESMDAVDNLTDLVGAKAVLGISSAVSEGDHATITGVVLSTQLQAGFWCREWGLFAQDPVAGEILYMITIDNQPEWLPASTAAAQVSATYAMNIAVANATNIEVQIDPAGLVDVEMLQSYMGLAKRSTAVALGDTALLENIPAGYFLECTTAGTTGATAPVISTVTEGQTITDGSVVWTVRKCFPTSGGTMNGNITMPSNGRIFMADNTSTLQLWGGCENCAGSALILRGKAEASNAGMASLRAYLDASNDSILNCYPDGRLEWRNTDLAGSSIVSKSTSGLNKYWKFASGLIIQTGVAAVGAGETYKSITLPISFVGISNYSVAYSFNLGSINGYASKTATTITLHFDPISEGRDVSWIAIGI